MLHDFLYRVWALFRRDRLEREMDEELQFHLEREAEKAQLVGETVEAAKRRARLAFGGVESVKEECREARGTAIVESWISDFRYAARILRNSPGFTLAAVFSLTIGIGANTAVFSLLDRVVFRPLPVERPDELVILNLWQDGKASSFSYPYVQELSRRQSALAGIFASADFPLKDMVLRRGGTPDSAAGRLVSGSYFKVLGVQAAAGRVLNEADDRAGEAGVAVISDRFWERQFQRSESALGETLTVNQAQLTIVGVAPKEFFGEKPGSMPDLWIPMSQQPKVMPGDLLSARFVTWLIVMGRLEDGVSRQAAASSLSALAGELGRFTIQSAGAGKQSIVLEEGGRGLEELRRDFGKPLRLMMAMVGLVLLIACFNVATLALARGSARSREFGVRLALGASRTRLMRQMMAESILLAAVGGSLGAGLALLGSQALIGLAGEGRPLSLAVAVDLRMLVFTGAVAAASTLVFGLLPAWMASSWLDPARSLGGESRTSTAPRRFVTGAQSLMVLQIGVSLAVVCGAVLLTRSLESLRHQDFGIRPAGLMLVKIPLELTPAAMKRQDLLRGEVLERVRGLPGVRLAAVSCCGPFDELARTGKVVSEGGDRVESDTTRFVHVSEGYAETMGMTVVAGRTLSATDRKGATQVAMLSEYAALRLFGQGRAVGKRIAFGDKFDGARAMEVVGVLQDARFAGPRDEFKALVFVPMAQQPGPVTSISVRSSGGLSLAAEIRRILEQTAPGVGLGSITTYESVIEQKLHTERMLAFLSASFAAMTLAMACVGLAGLMSFTAAKRRREIGVRVALGARPAQLIVMLLKQTAALLAAGIALGAAGAFAIGQAMRSFLFGVAPNDPVSFVAGACALGLAGLWASFLPAWRASRADPLESLRVE